MKLSYTEYSIYKKCPKSYYNTVNGVDPPEQQSKYFALYGLLVEAFFKMYTNLILKRHENLNNDQICDILRKLWEWVLNNNYVVWDDPWVKESSEHIFMSAYEDVVKNINSFDFWKYATAEVPFEILLKKNQDTLSCRLDFIINKPEGTTELLDGKGTHKMDKNVDIEQLYFYILIYLLHYKKLPDKAGFLYYRYQLIKYIDFDMKIIMDFKDKLAIVKKAIKEDKIFEAKVGISKQCKWCAYKLTCTALIAKRKERAEKKAPLLPFEFDGSILSFSTKGLCDEGSN